MGGWEIRDVVQVSQLFLTSINYNSTHDFRRKKIALVKMQTLDQYRYLILCVVQW